MLNHSEKKHYQRHLTLPEIGKKGQEKLKNASVLVIGAGGLGCPVLQYLSAAGIGKLGIIDGDIVSESNLQRQILYNYNDIGKSKSEIAAQKLSLLNPFIEFKVFNTFLTTKNVLDILSQFDIIVDGSDNFETRYLVNDACIILNKPFVFGSIYKFEGQVSVFNYKNGATYRCLYPNPPEEAQNCSEIGVLGVLPGIIGCFQANEVIKIITELGTVLSGKLLLFNALENTQMTLNISLNEENLKINKLQESYDFSCTIDDMNSISVSNFKIKQEEFILIDVREIEEFDQFNIGGINIPLSTFEHHDFRLNLNKKIVICCQSGKRSQKAIKILKQKGFKQLLNLKNGLDDW